jgi:hypothetical protein
VATGRKSHIPNLKSQIQPHLTAAVDGIRASGNMDDLPRGLLTRAWYRALASDAAGSAADLDAAQEIAERGPMPLFQADVLLTRARLGIAEVRSRRSEISGRREDVLRKVRAELAEARRLIDKHGYHRRDEELADAEAALRTLESL